MLKICERKLGLGVVIGSGQSRGNHGNKVHGTFQHFSFFFQNSLNTRGKIIF